MSEGRRPVQNSDNAYVLDEPYTWSYFEFQNPLLLSYVAMLHGHAGPNPYEAFSYCDLGCGNGVTLNFLAASFPKGRFVGVDFNPTHIENAATCAAEAFSTNIAFLNQSFEAFAEHEGEPFDYIALHGIYSWVGAGIRKQILEIVRRKLKPGGLVYVSYNCLPGWSELIPLWKMMNAHTSDLEMDSLSKARHGLTLLETLRDNGARYFTETPAAGRYLDKMLGRNLSYVAHEFCNDTFEPQYFIDVAGDFSSAGLRYAGTAKIHRNDLAAIVPPKLLDHVRDGRDRTEAESRASFVRNEFFRRDIYARPGPAPERPWSFDDMVLGAKVTEPEIESKISHNYRSYELDETLLTLIAARDWRIRDLKNTEQLSRLDGDHIDRQLHRCLAGGQFQTILKPGRPRSANPDKPLVMGDTVNRVFLKRLIDLDGKAYLTARNFGQVVRLRLIYALFTEALLTRSMNDARAHVTSRLERIPPADRQRLGVPGDTDLSSWILQYERRYREQKLPILMKYGILTQ